MLPQVQKVMTVLRSLVKSVRENNKKIDVWVDQYLEECALHGRPVEILTPSCLSKDLEERRETQGGKLIPLCAEQRLFLDAIPEIVRTFRQNGFTLSWWFTFNETFVERTRLDANVKDEYKTMLGNLAARSPETQDTLILLDWDTDVVGKRMEPSSEVLQRFNTLVPKDAFRLECDYWRRRFPNFPGSDKMMEEELRHKIACEAEEGDFLSGPESPFPNGFILIPLEYPERLVFHEILAHGFRKHVAAVLRPYPWRIKQTSYR